MADVTLSGGPTDVSLGNATLRIQQVTSLADGETWPSGFGNLLACIVVVKSDVDADVQVASISAGTATFGVETGTPNATLIGIGN